MERKINHIIYFLRFKINNINLKIIELEQRKSIVKQNMNKVISKNKSILNQPISRNYKIFELQCLEFHANINKLNNYKNELIELEMGFRKLNLEKEFISNSIKNLERKLSLIKQQMFNAAENLYFEEVHDLYATGSHRYVN